MPPHGQQKPLQLPWRPCEGCGTLDPPAALRHPQAASTGKQPSAWTVVAQLITHRMFSLSVMFCTQGDCGTYAMRPPTDTVPLSTCSTGEQGG